MPSSATELVPCRVGDPDVRVVRSSRRSVGVEVHDGGAVLVRAPQAATDDQIDDLLRRKSVWLYAKRRDAAGSPEPDTAPLVAGSSVLYQGRARRLRVRRGADVPLAFDGAAFWVQPDALGDVEGLVRAWLEDRAAEAIPPLVAETAARLGFRYREVRVVDLRARWGSFSARAVLTFNWRLVMAPPFVLRYVVAHELAHTVEPNHGPRFWNLVRSVCPRTEEARAWLVANEGELERVG